MWRSAAVRRGASPFVATQQSSQSIVARTWPSLIRLRSASLRRPGDGSRSGAERDRLRWGAMPDR